VVLHGDVPRMRELLAASVAEAPATAVPVPTASVAVPPPPPSGGTADGLQAMLLEQICQQLKLRPEDIDADTDLQDIGFDSITLTQFNDALNERFGLALSPTVYFEHTTVRMLAEHIGGEHGVRIEARRAAPQDVALHAPAPAAASRVTAPDPDQGRERLRTMLLERVCQQLKLRAEDIDADTDLQDIGFDSITLTQFNDALNEQLGLALSPTTYFEHTTVALLAEHLWDAHGIRPGADTAPAPDDAVSHTAASNGEPPANGASQDRLQALLLDLVCQQLKLRAEDIDLDTELQDIGFDSISLTQFNDTLNERLGLALSPTVYFEYATVRLLAAYLRDTEGVRLRLHTEVLQEPVHHAAEAPPPAAETDVQARVAASSDTCPDGIAIVGMSGRFPGADTLDEFWQNVRKGRDGIGTVPAERWSMEDFLFTNKDEARKQRGSYSPHGGFLRHLDQIDDGFFAGELAGWQAGTTELLLLQAAWTMLESAGYTRDRLAAMTESNVGVFVGAIPMPESPAWPGPEHPQDSCVTVRSLADLAHRISRLCRFNGPSLALDTQSSSSITALHYACESLRRGECRAAMAGGVSVLYPGLYRGLCQIDAIGSGPDSRSFTDGDGLLLAEGVGVVLLKRLEDALRDGDEVLAVVRATSVNYAGNASGLLIPDGAAQTRLFTDVIRKAGVDARSISYVECAAFGAPLGDALEVSSLTRAFRAFTPDVGFCALGSVKSAIGHATAASGMSQLFKVVQQMRHRELAPLLKGPARNPHLRLADSPFTLQEALAPWHQPTLHTGGRTTTAPRRALVNSFGAGGAYACALVEEYVAAPAAGPGREPPRRTSPLHLVVLSARTESKLRTQARELVEFIAGHPGVALSDVSHVLQHHRESMAWRMALLVESIADLERGLEHVVHQAAGEPPVPTFVRHCEGKASKESEGRREAGLRTDQAALDASELLGLAHAWVQGAEIANTNRTDDIRQARVALPTYPFQGDRGLARVRRDTATAPRLATDARARHAVAATTFE